ncbi:hypothetical protein HHI36_010145 [Cryptolaemus montrouzieri]|uniref:Uncharacterized protein n=1 Tax=Cryptolaemus montrouzieri TaxID=559131 RepID=A0ABD2MHY6_9CUCU
MTGMNWKNPTLRMRKNEESTRHNDLDFDLDVELSTDESDGEYVPSPPQYYFGKMTRAYRNAFKWTSAEPPTNVRKSAHNILKTGTHHGITTTVSALGPEPEEIKIWTILFTDDMFADITQWTNENIEY